MIFRPVVRTLSCFVALPVLLGSRPADAQIVEDSVAVVEIAKAYHEFLAAGDSSAALQLLSPDVVIVEGGNIEDLGHYRTGHLMADMRYAQSVTRETGDIRVVIEGNVAWAASTASITGERQGEPFNSTSAELMVLTNRDGRWTIRAIHWSSRRSR